MLGRLIPGFLLLFLPSVSGTCSNHALLGCVLRLKAQQVPFERNMLNVVFNIATEAKLLRTCRVYASTMPCFREKVMACGNEKQKRQLDEVGRMLMFMCSPFSLQRQRQLIAHQKCISAVLNLPPSRDCILENSYYKEKINSCRQNCAHEPSTFVCSMDTWRSEQNSCTLQSLHTKCGEDAAGLYEQMQVTVFDPKFPILCNATQAPQVKETFGQSKVKPAKPDSALVIPITSPYFASTTTTPQPMWSLVTAVTYPPTIRLPRPKIVIKNALKTKKITLMTTPVPSISTTRSSYATPKSTTTAWEPPSTWLPYPSPETSTSYVNHVSVSRIPKPWDLFGMERSIDGIALNVGGNGVNDMLNMPQLTMMQQVFAAPSKQSAEVYDAISTSTSTTIAPRTIKVINILKRFLPDYMPQLSNILEQVHPGSPAEFTTTTERPAMTTLSPIMPEAFSLPPTYPPSTPPSPPTPPSTTTTTTPSPPPRATWPPTTTQRNMHRIMPKLGQRSAFIFPSSSTTPISTSTTPSTAPTHSTPPPLAPRPSVQPLFAGLNVNHTVAVRERMAFLPSSLFNSVQKNVAPIRSQFPMPPAQENPNAQISYLSALRTPAPFAEPVPLESLSIPTLFKNLGAMRAIPAREVFETADHANSVIVEQPVQTVYPVTSMPMEKETPRRAPQSFQGHPRRSARWRPWYLGGPEIAA